MSDIRLKLKRPSGSVTVSIERHPKHEPGTAPSFVLIKRTFGEQQVVIGILAEELDSVISAFGECRRLTLGVPDPKAEMKRIWNEMGQRSR